MKVCQSEHFVSVVILLVFPSRISYDGGVLLLQVRSWSSIAFCYNGNAAAMSHTTVVGDKVS